MGRINQHFLSRLRDALFVVNEDDIDHLKQVLRSRWLKRRRKAFPGAADSELLKAVNEAIEIRYAENFAWFAHRCRRSIPPPSELEAALRRVVGLYADLEDSATGMQLFTPKTWAIFKSMVIHHPDVNYY